MKPIAAAAILALALPSLAAAQTPSSDYPPCKTRAQDHCTVVAMGHHMHGMMKHKKMHHHHHMAAAKPAPAETQK